MLGKIPLSNFWLIGIVLLAIDRIVKYLFSLVSEPLGWDALNFGLNKNTNIFLNLNLGQSLSVIIMAIVLVFIIFVFRSFKDQSPYFLLSAVFILVGGVSNLFDRLFFGYVIDYINLGRIIVFNLSDIFIVTGALGIIYFYKKLNVV